MTLTLDSSLFKAMSDINNGKENGAECSSVIECLGMKRTGVSIFLVFP